MACANNHSFQACLFLAAGAPANLSLLAGIHFISSNLFSLIQFSSFLCWSLIRRLIQLDPKQQKQQSIYSLSFRLVFSGLLSVMNKNAGAAVVCFWFDWSLSQIQKSNSQDIRTDNFINKFAASLRLSFIHSFHSIWFN